MRYREGRDAGGLLSGVWVNREETKVGFLEDGDYRMRR